ncbi:MAG: hypothetical protein D6806_16530 [Deltaproteobacteria bacterium]|nr:MAG: hypothetical protein D6806_16530 [Deltaproteobacteria bacterium]
MCKRHALILPSVAAAYLLVVTSPSVRAVGNEPEVEHDVFDDQDAGEEEFEEEFLLLEEAEKVYSASRHEQAIKLSPVAVTVITRQQIAVSGALTLPDLLRRVPGTQAVVASPMLTGVVGRLPFTTENHDFLVLVDGKQANIEQLGQPPWEILPINLEDIDRIEVIRGPVSALYGANALAGVISIYTRSATEKSGAWAKVEAGQWNRWTVAGRASLRQGSFGASISAGYDRAGDFGNPRGSGKKVWKVRLLGDWRPKEGHKLCLDFEGSSGGGNTPTTAGNIDGRLLHFGTQLSYESERLKGHLYFVWDGYSGRLLNRLDYAGLHLADFSHLDVTNQTVDAEVQWSPQKPTEWLSILGGARMRFELLGCPGCIPDDYEETRTVGISVTEARAGAFVSLEVEPTRWLFVNGSGRLDYNTSVGFFFSPRLSVTLGVSGKDTLRLAFAQSFRKPNFLERTFHPNVTFPDSSPIQGADRELFREFMTRVVGNKNLPAEKLMAFELGYNRQWLPGLRTGVELFLHRYTDTSSVSGNIVEQPNGLPDLHKSSYQFDVDPSTYIIAGAEIFASWRSLDWLWIEGSWTVIGCWNDWFEKQLHITPKNLFTIGFDMLHPSGLLGSLYAVGRSDFYDTSLPNPEGLLGKLLTMHHPVSIHLQGRFGWRTQYGPGQLEVGLKFLLPLSFDSDPLITYDAGGITAADGTQVGGTMLAETILAYLQLEL